MNTHKDFANRPDPGYGFIYILRSPSGKAYIGQTRTSIRRRIHTHCHKTGWVLATAIKKYGIANFFIGEIGCYPECELDAMEIRFIKEFNTLVPNGYNLMTGGGSCGSHSIVTRQKLSIAHKGRHHSAETKLKLSVINKNVSLERRQAISARVRNASKETRRKLSEANTGRTRSIEAKMRMASAHIGVPLSKEHRQRQVEGWVQRRLLCKPRKTRGKGRKTTAKTQMVLFDK